MIITDPWMSSTKHLETVFMTLFQRDRKHVFVLVVEFIIVYFLCLSIFANYTWRSITFKKENELVIYWDLYSLANEHGSQKRRYSTLDPPQNSASRSAPVILCLSQTFKNRTHRYSRQDVFSKAAVLSKHTWWRTWYRNFWKHLWNTFSLFLMSKVHSRSADLSSKWLVVRLG